MQDEQAKRLFQKLSDENKKHQLGREKESKLSVGARRDLRELRTILNQANLETVKRYQMGRELFEMDKEVLVGNIKREQLLQAVGEIQNLQDSKPESFLAFYGAAKEMQQALIENAVKSRQEYEESRYQVYQLEQYQLKINRKN